MDTRGYSAATLRADLVAGLTASAVVVPKAVAYATIAAIPVQIGLYTAILPMVVYALLGTSRVLSVSTTTTIAILTGAELRRVAPGAGAAELTVAVVTLGALVGAFLILASALRLGFVANFISEPVLAGFKAGIGLVIVLDQVPKLLGIHITKAGFFRDAFSIVGHLPETSIATLILALSLFAIIVLLERFAPRAPAPLVAIGAAILASGVFGLQQQGVEVIGAVSGQFPVIVMPDLALARAMWPAAAGIALMSFTETVASARAFAIPGESRPVPNRELLATGASNVVGAFFSSMPAGGGTTQTAVNRQAGARTQVAAAVTAGVALATLVVLSPFIGLMPQAALAAVVIAYSVGLVKPAEFMAIRRVRQTEFWWAIIACAGVVLLGTLEGILVAVIASLLSLGQQAYDPEVHVIGRKRGTSVFRPRSAEHPDDESWPGLLILRVEGRAFFLNAQRIGDKMLSAIDEAHPQVVVLDASAVIDIEYTALKMLDEAEEKLQRQGISLWIAALNPEELTLVQRSALGQRLGRARMLFNLQTAVERYEAQMAGNAATS